jgi:hypothetical protein
MRCGCVLMLAAMVGCSDGQTRLASGSSVLVAVSYDQAWAAVLTDATRLSNGLHTGKLEVVPIAGGGASVPLDDNSSGGLYERGTALWYLGGVTIVNEGTPATPHAYGALYVWMPGMPVPAKVGNNVREFYPSQDGSACVFMDWSQQTIAASNTGKLVTASAAACASGSCQPLTIASGITAAQASWRIADNGQVLFATVRGANVTDAGKAVLVTADGTVTSLSTGVATRSAMMTPGGDVVAWVEGTNVLQVTAVATPSNTQKLAVTAPLIDAAAMIDGGHFVLSVREGADSGTASLVQVSATANTPLDGGVPLELFVSQAAPGASNDFLFYSQVANGDGTRDLWMLDLTTAGAQPVPLAAKTPLPLGENLLFSDDGSWLRYFDQYDPATRVGEVDLIQPAHPVRTVVADLAHQAAFIPRTSRLLYIGAPDATTGAGVLTLLPSLDKSALVEGVGEVNFVASRTSPSRVYYTQHTGGGDDGVWYMSAP